MVESIKIPVTDYQNDAYIYFLTQESLSYSKQRLPNKVTPNGARTVCSFPLSGGGGVGGVNSPSTYIYTITQEVSRRL